MSLYYQLKLQEIEKKDTLTLKLIYSIYWLLNVLTDWLTPITQTSKGVWRGLKNIFCWWPEIWRDRQWDFEFFYIILRKKLKLMEQFFNSKHAWTVNSSDVAKEISECVKMLDRLIENDYAKEDYDRYTKKWGEAKYTFLAVKDNPQYSELQVEYPNEKTEEDHEERIKDIKTLSLLENKRYEDDLNDLFTLLRNKIRNWWD